MRQIVAPLRGAMGSGPVTVKHTTSSMRQYVAPPSGDNLWITRPPSGDNLWITRPPSGGYILCQCDITSHRLRRATISCASVRGSHTISCVNATKCRTALRAVLYLVVLHLVPPPGAMVLYLVLRQNVAPPCGRLGVTYYI